MVIYEMWEKLISFIYFSTDIKLILARLKPTGCLVDEPPEQGTLGDSNAGRGGIMAF
jgi:hypothetical protein